MCIIDFSRFEDGLRTLGVLDAIRAHPVEMQALFVVGSGSTLSLDEFNDAFTIMYSAEGSNRYRQETETYAMWLDYLEHINGKLCLTTGVLLKNFHDPVLGTSSLCWLVINLQWFCHLLRNIFVFTR